MSSMWKRQRHRERPTVKETAAEALWRKIGLWSIPLRLLWAAAHRIAFGFSLLISTWPGRAVAGVGAGAILLDASYGADPLALPVSIPVVLVVALVVGVLAYARRMRWEEHVTAVLHDAVPGHGGQTPAIVWFPPRPGKLLQLGRWLNKYEFGFRIPAKMTRSQEAEVSEHLRARVPMSEGTSLEIKWDWRAGKAKARLVPDLEEMAVRAPDEVSDDPAKIPLGKGLSGVVYWVLDNNFGNIFITGGPGGGKSVLINSIMRHILEWLDYFEVFCIDLKGGVELSHLERYPNVRTTADDLDSALELLRKLRGEVDRRQKLLREYEVKKIAELNEAREAAGEGALKRLIILVDELAELTDIPEQGGDKQENKQRAETKQLLDSIVRLGRAGGVHLVAALQRPDAKYLGGAMRSNIQARVITGRVDRAGAQMVESSIADELPAIPGRGVFWLGGVEEIVQFYFTKDEDLDAVLETEEEVLA